MSTFRNALFYSCIAMVALSGSADAGAKEGNSGQNKTSGAASWYGGQFHGRKTANGERFDMNGLTAAHRSLPFGTKVRVTNQKTGKSVVVRINDRGPFVGRRVIDLSRGAAKAINMLGTGVASVNLQVLK